MSETVSQPIATAEIDPATLPQREVTRWTFVFVGGLTFNIDVRESLNEEMGADARNNSFNYVRRDDRRNILEAQSFEAQNRISVGYVKGTEPIYPDGYDPRKRHITEIASALAAEEEARRAQQDARAAARNEPVTDDDF
jgi:hypothetical protein